MLSRRFFLAFSAVGLALALSGCGGGENADAPAKEEVPADYGEQSAEEIMNLPGAPGSGDQQP